MITVFTIVIILACIVLAFFILVQNPKGGGLSGSFGSMSTQVMGVQQSDDIMEKGTWTTMGIIAAICLICVMFYDNPLGKESKKPAQTEQSSKQQQAPAQQAPASGN